MGETGRAEAATVRVTHGLFQPCAHPEDAPFSPISVTSEKRWPLSEVMGGRVNIRMLSVGLLKLRSPRVAAIVALSYGKLQLNCNNGEKGLSA